DDRLERYLGGRIWEADLNQHFRTYCKRRGDIRTHATLAQDVTAAKEDVAFGSSNRHLQAHVNLVTAPAPRVRCRVSLCHEIAVRAVPSSRISLGHLLLIAAYCIPDSPRIA